MVTVGIDAAGAGRPGLVPQSNPSGPALAAALCAGRLTAIGGWLPAAAATSWLPRGARGWFPVPCYLLRSGANAVLIDTGLAIHAAFIERGLAETLAPEAALDVLLTRREPDTLMNLPWIARRFRTASVRCCGPVDPFDYVEKLEEAMTAAQMRAIVGVPVEFLVPSGTMHLGAFRFELVRPAIRVLATDWFYEQTTGTLFSSDMWAFVSAPAPDDPVCSGADERIGVDRILDHLATKFDWLEGIDTDPIGRALAEALAGTLSWDMVRELRRLWPRKLLIKGVLTPHDARLALDCGADAIVVSNHGGRNLDMAPAPIEVLPRIADTIAGRVPVLIDGGVRRGGDIAKALVLGASAVLVGRATLFSVAAGGEAGARRMLEIFKHELYTTMGLLGCGKVAALTRDLLFVDDDAPHRVRPS